MGNEDPRVPMVEGEPAGRELQWASFAVDETPRCMWGEGLAAQNRTFLEGLDPSFFNHVAETNLPALESSGRHHAALAIRLAYAQALETLFALICAAVQAPHCPLGWILSYENRHLFSVVRKLNEGSHLFARHPQPLTWMRLSHIIHAFTHADEREDSRIKTLFANTWAGLAHELLDRGASDEYNSIKHGFRARPGGFSLRIGSRDPDAAPVIDSRSEFGTRSYHVERLSRDRINFYAEDAARNWAPIALAVRIELIVLSIQNVVSYLLTRVGSAGGKVQFRWPEDTEALQMAWQSDFSIESMRGGMRLSRDEIEPKSVADVLGAYEDGRGR
jgi:hypothetical protein